MKIKKINIVCHSHYNMNGCDHQTVVSAVNKQIIDKALTLIDKHKGNPSGEKFCWTAEAAVPLLEWWAEASPDRRRHLIEAVDNGLFEVCALPYNVSSSVSEAEANKVANWIPSDIFDALNVRTAIQSGVDGMSAAVINKLTAKGIRFAWVMPEEGGKLLREFPFAFNWKITSSARVLAFQGGYVGNFKDIMFGAPVREKRIKTASTIFNFSDSGDILPMSEGGDEAAKRIVAEAYVRVTDYIENVEKKGNYPFSVLPLSYVSGIRGGNEPPCEDIIEFVKLWNSMGLKPRLAITTAADALSEMQVESDAIQIPTFSGQWTDSFGSEIMSAPKEVALNRETLRLYKHLQNLSSVRVPGDTRTSELIMRDVCSLYEHNISAYSCAEQVDDISLKESEMTKFAPVYRAHARAEYLLCEKVRKTVEYDKDGIHVYNPSSSAYSGEITVPADVLNGDYISVMERDTMTIKGLSFFPTRLGTEKTASFWADIPPCSERFYTLMSLATPEEIHIEAPIVETDGNGWPLKVKYSDGKTISTSVIGDVEAVIPRGGRKSSLMLAKCRKEDRENILNSIIRTENCSYSLTITSEKDNRIVVTQEFMSSFGNGKRVMTIYKTEPRVNVSITLDRLPGLEPAAIYAKFSLDTGNAFPVTSCGGLVFDPSRSILNGCDHDCIGIDSWISYPYARTVFFSKDAPFMSFGGNNYRAQTKAFSEDKGTICALLFDNTRYYNIIGDSYGAFSYSFDIIAEDAADDFGKLNDLAEKYFSSPVPVVSIR